MSRNVNQNMKIENLEQKYKQRQNQSYKRNMRTRRNNWKTLVSIIVVNVIVRNKRNLTIHWFQFYRKMLKSIETNLLQRKEFLKNKQKGFIKKMHFQKKIN